ncbi:helix-turn-helix domain-containing protein [Nocardia fusca]|uniref:helix-turn-helix domain-containing protein n=1 Tax=Nocardia fusca TaxID=941183 RepID=UPI0037C9A3CC
MTKPHLTIDELSQRWGKPRQSLAQWRYLGKGPAYLRIGRKVLYPLESVVEFERQSMSDRGAA